ncbi:MAG: glycosyltransferase [Akkermansiaceae bacterium]
MAQHVKISVIMPCFNAEATLARAVQSIRKQTWSDWELIIVDDGSTDSSPTIASELASVDKRIRVINLPHQGVAAASNTGFAESCGSIIARMDADDVSHPQRLEKQRSALGEQAELDAVSCLVHFAGDRQTAGGYAHHVDWTNSHLTPEEISLNRFIDLPFPHPSIMYRRTLVEKFGGYREGCFPEDYEMILRWISMGVKIGKVREVLYDWHDPPTRLSRTDNRYDMQAFHHCKAPYLAEAIRGSGNEQRELWIWGAGRPARKCAQPLEAAWKPATGFIDIDPVKIGRTVQGRPVIGPDALPIAQQAVIVSYVGNRGAGSRIRDALLAKGRIEGEDFWICA